MTAIHQRALSEARRRSRRGESKGAAEGTENTEHTDQMLRLITACKGKRVVVFGDLIADEYVYGRIARVSREAPVLILEYDTTAIVPGGAGNAANNVASLGGRVRLVSLVGRDEPGDRLITVLPRAVERDGLSRPAGYQTPVKTRILAGGIHSAKQQVVRIDRHTAEPVSEGQQQNEPPLGMVFRVEELVPCKGVPGALEEALFVLVPDDRRVDELQ